MTDTTTEENEIVVPIDIHDFKCACCLHPMDPTVGELSLYYDATLDKSVPVHKHCYSDMVNITCHVCNKTIHQRNPQTGKIELIRTPFFENETLCVPCYQEMRKCKRQCTGCRRFEPYWNPQKQKFATLNDGRCVCSSCSRTAVLNSNDIQSIYSNIVHFLEHHLQLFAPASYPQQQQSNEHKQKLNEIPIMVVTQHTLFAQISKNKSHAQIADEGTLRGLCISEAQYSLLTTHSDEDDDDNEEEKQVLVDDDDDDDDDDEEDYVSISAIVCLGGLPKELLSSVLAHETTHAYIKLHPQYNPAYKIPSRVEEGVCQLIAYLYLLEELEATATGGEEEKQEQNDNGPTDDELREYFKNSIKDDTDEIYGDGFRIAYAIYQAIGIQELMSYVIEHRSFPSFREFSNRKISDDNDHEDSELEEEEEGEEIQTLDSDVSSQKEQNRRGSLIPRLSFTMMDGNNKEFLCSGCNNEKGGIELGFITIVNHTYHMECLKCTICEDSIDPKKEFSYIFKKEDDDEEEDSMKKDAIPQPVHKHCQYIAKNNHPMTPSITCMICHQSIPKNKDTNKVSVATMPYFTNEKMCPTHKQDNTRRCTGCRRFEPQPTSSSTSTTSVFNTLTDHRCICSSCARTALFHNNDNEYTKLYEQVIDFLKHKLKLPNCDTMHTIPIKVVSHTKLVSYATSEENQYYQPTDTGLVRSYCLLGWEHEQGEMSPRVVKAILMLGGLPKDLVAILLAHEATHVWIQLMVPSAPKQISPQAEEGFCRLLSYLFFIDSCRNNNLPLAQLSSKQQSPPTDKQLREYFKYSIKNDKDPIYGDGFRIAYALNESIGLKKLITHLLEHGKFPTIEGAAV